MTNRYFVVIDLDRELIKSFFKQREADEFFERSVEIDPVVQDAVYLEINTKTPSITVRGMKDKGYLVGTRGEPFDRKPRKCKL